MPYTVKMDLIDFTERDQFAGTHPASWRLSFTGGDPALPPPTTLASNAANTPLTFAGLSDQTHIRGAVSISNANAPGDVFRSGMFSPLPRSPATISLIALPHGPGVLPNFPGTAVTYAQMASRAGTPLTFNVDNDVELAVTLLSGIKFDPRSFTLASLTFAPLAGSNDTLVASFTGTVEFRTFFVGAHAAVRGTINVQLVPSGNANAPDDVVHAVASGLTLNFPTIPAVGGLIGDVVALFGPLFNGNISKAVSDALNASIKSTLDSVKQDSSLDHGTRDRLSGTSASVWRFQTSPTDLAITLVLGKMVDAPQGTLHMVITPAPVLAVAKTYTITVTDAANGHPVPNATVRLGATSATPTRVPSVASHATGLDGKATISMTLQLGSKRVSTGHGDHDFAQLPVTLDVTAAGFGTAHKVLIPV